MGGWFDVLVDFVRANQAWAAPIMFTLAFAESLAFLSLIVPAWGALIAIGAMVAASDLPFLPIWLAGAAGAALGDWLSYWFGFHFKDRARQIWPLSKHPDMLVRGEAFIRRWGVPSIFIARFSGPLRATVPLVAGIFEMSYWRFQLANVTSALAWAAILLIFGDTLAASLTMMMPKP